MADSFESTRRSDRATVAAYLRRLAAGLETGEGVTLTDDDRTAAVAPPDEFEFEVELELEDEHVELELELEWTDEEGKSGDKQTAARPEGTTVDADEDGSAIPTGATLDLSESNGVEDGPAEAEADAGRERDPPTSAATFELYRDRADEWRWRLRHRNGNVIADSGEGYDRKAGARNGLSSVKTNAPRAPVEELE